MRKLAKLLASSFTAIALALSFALPANADAVQLWKTTSSNQYKGIALDPKSAINNGVSAVAWIERIDNDTSKLNAKVRRNGVWSATTKVFDIPWNWWTGFDVQVTDSGTVYVAYSDMDVNMQVATNTTGITWTTNVVDNSGSNIGSMAAGGFQLGNKVTFTANRAVSETSREISTYSYDEADSGAGWVKKVVKTFTLSDFSACTIKRSYYASCEMGAGEPEIRTAADGSQLLLLTVGRNSSADGGTGHQFKLFKFHRSSPVADWVADGAVYTLTLKATDDSYAFFLTEVVNTPEGKYAFAITTGKTGDHKNTVRLYTGDTFASAATAQDTTYLASLGQNDNGVLVAYNGDFYVAVDDAGVHRFGKVGTFASTTRKLSVSTSEDVKKLLVVGGKITAVITTPRVSTSIMTLTDSTWSAKSKVMNSAANYTWRTSCSVTDGTNLLLVSTTYASGIDKILNGYTN